MISYYLGIDIGGTKSHALIADEDGQALALVQGRGRVGDDETLKYDDLTQIAGEIIDHAAQKAGIRLDQIAGAGFGIAGLDWPSQKPNYMDAIRKVGLNGPFEAYNDAVIGLLAGASQGWGVGISAGTGCNCWGIDRQRRMGQVTGMGEWMGEAAGASELVLAAVRAISRAWTRRGPETVLTTAFCDRTGAAHALDLLEGLTMERYHLNASAAPLVFQVAALGDPVAQDLVRWAGRELGDLALGVIRQLGIEDQEFEVVLSGSFWKGSPVVAEEAAAAVHLVAPLAVFVRLNAPPAVGGVLLGMEAAGKDALKAQARLLKTTRAILQSVDVKSRTL